MQATCSNFEFSSVEYRVRFLFSDIKKAAFDSLFHGNKLLMVFVICIHLQHQKFKYAFTLIFMHCYDTHQLSYVYLQLFKRPKFH